MGALRQQVSDAGTDRPAPTPFRNHNLASRRLIAASLITLTVWCALIWISRNQPPSVNVALGQLARSLAAAAFLSGAAMRFATWRLTGEAQLAWSAMALLVIGVTLPMVAAIRLLPVDVGVASSPAAAARLLMVFAVITLSAFMLTTNPVYAGLRPIKFVAPLLLGFGIATAVVVFRGQPAAPPTPLQLGLFRVSEWMATVLWLGLAARYAWSGRRRRSVTQLWGAASLALMAITELLQALSFSGMVQVS